MLSATVGLSEDWRKKGGGKIRCSLLRQVRNEEIDLDDVNERFRYVESADAGRRQAARIQDVVEERTGPEALSPEELQIVANLSPPRDGDFSTDDEQRNLKNDDFSKRPLFSKKHEASERERLKKQREEKRRRRVKNPPEPRSPSRGARQASGRRSLPRRGARRPRRRRRSRGRRGSSADVCPRSDLLRRHCAGV